MHEQLGLAAHAVGMGTHSLEAPASGVSPPSGTCSRQYWVAEEQTALPHGIEPDQAASAGSSDTSGGQASSLPPPSS